MDSSNISTVSFRDVTIRGSNVATPIFMKIGNRVHGEQNIATNHFVPGSISDVNFTNVTAVHWGNCSSVKPGGWVRTHNSSMGG